MPLPAVRNALGSWPFQVLGHYLQELPVRVSGLLSVANSVFLVIVAVQIRFMFFLFIGFCLCMTLLVEE